MELIAVDSEGVAGVIANNQSTLEEAVFSIPFVINNRNSTVYYVESDKVFGTPLSDPQNTWVSQCGLENFHKNIHMYILHSIIIISVQILLQNWLLLHLLIKSTNRLQECRSLAIFINNLLGYDLWKLFSQLIN